MRHAMSVCSSQPPEGEKKSDGGCCGGNADLTAHSGSTHSDHGAGLNKSGGGCCGSDGGSFDCLLWGSLSVFVAGISIHWFWPSAPEALHAYGHACFTLIKRAWWGLALGILVFAILSRLPRELVAAILGRGGSVRGLFRAVGAGVMLDMCNHGILMVGMGLYQRGASLGQTVAFLIASPWNSFSLTLILAALIGWKWVGLFILLSMVIALVTGWIVERLVAAGKLPANPNKVDLPTDYRMGPEIRKVLVLFRPGFKNYGNLLKHGFEGSTMILRWIFLGFVLAAAIQAFVPTETFQAHFGPTVAGLLLTLLATVILEVCSEGSSPIAADLLNRANAPGNAFVFLMAGAATDYTEIMALKETTRSWKATLALPLIATPQVLLIGWLIQTWS